MTERDFAIDIVRQLQNAGHQALWAGGCVRDEHLGLVPKDYDVATSARPEQVQQLFRRTIAVGLSFGVIQVLGPRRGGRFHQVEVATFRSDGEYSDGRHPDQVTFSTAEEDALRRDFTINGMFKDPLTNTIVDYVGGQRDLQEKILRAIGDPFQRIKEDKLRMLRGVRMATRFDLEIESGTASAIAQMAGDIEVVSAERIADELRKLLVLPHRERGARLLIELNLAATLFPELMTLSVSEIETATKALRKVSDNTSFPLTFAVLLQFLSVEVVSGICLRLRLSNEERERIEWLIEHQSTLKDVHEMRTCHLKRLLIHPGIDDLFVLHRIKGMTSSVEFCEARFGEWDEQELNPAPLITGHDLMAMDLKPGPVFKELLEMVRDEQLDGSIATKEEALQLVRDRMGRVGE